MLSYNSMLTLYHDVGNVIGRDGVLKWRLFLMEWVSDFEPRCLCSLEAREQASM